MGLWDLTPEKNTMARKLCKPMLKALLTAKRVEEHPAWLGQP
jgi:hypothetical protein